MTASSGSRARCRWRKPSPASRPTSPARASSSSSEIDQSKLAADAGIKLRPSTLLVFGNPPLGTQFITSNPECRARLAGPLAADAGRQWRRMGGLDRFRMDRQAPQHQGPRRAVQDGDHGRRLRSRRPSRPSNDCASSRVRLTGRVNERGLTGTQYQLPIEEVSFDEHRKIRRGDPWRRQRRHWRHRPGPARRDVGRDDRIARSSAAPARTAAARRRKCWSPPVTRCTKSSALPFIISPSASPGWTGPP